MKAVFVIFSALMLAACANKEKLISAAKDNAKPVYEECVKEYKKTMSDSDARKACTQKLKQGYQAATEK